MEVRQGMFTAMFPGVACIALAQTPPSRLAAVGWELLKDWIGKAHQRQIELMTQLRDRGVDVNARHNNGMTALMIAVQTGQRDAVQLLLSKGADPKVKASNGNTALGLSLKRGDAGISQFLKDAGAID